MTKPQAGAMSPNPTMCDTLSNVELVAALVALHDDDRVWAPSEPSNAYPLAKAKAAVVEAARRLRWVNTAEAARVPSFGELQ